jgi:hypothetical protein
VAAPAPEAAARDGVSPALAENRVPGHGFVRGKHLCIAKTMAMLTMCSHWGFRRRLRRGAKGGKRSPASERRRGMRLGKEIKEAGRSFFTTE